MFGGWGWRKPSLQINDAISLLNYGTSKCREHKMSEQAICLNEPQSSRMYCTACFENLNNHKCQNRNCKSLQQFLKKEKQTLSSVGLAFDRQMKYEYDAHERTIANLREQLQQCVQMMKKVEYQTQKKSIVNRGKTIMSDVAGLINNHIKLSTSTHKKDRVYLNLASTIQEMWSEAQKKMKQLREQQKESANGKRQEVIDKIMQILHIQVLRAADHETTKIVNNQIKEINAQYQSIISSLQTQMNQLKSNIVQEQTMHLNNIRHLQTHHLISENKSKLMSCLAYSEAVNTVLRENTGDYRRLSDMKNHLKKPIDGKCDCRECQQSRQKIGDIHRQFQKMVDSTVQLLVDVQKSRGNKAQITQLQSKLQDYGRQQANLKIEIESYKHSKYALQSQINNLQQELKRQPTEPDIHLSLQLDRHKKLMKLSSQLLNEEERLWVIDRMQEIQPFQSSVLIFTASHASFSNEAFHKCCDQWNSLILIAKTKDGFKFGGYSQQVMDKQSEDDKSHIFSITNRVMMGLTKEGKATRKLPNYGPLFGYNDITIDGKAAKSNHHTLHASYIKANIETIPENTILFGKEGDAILEDYEVFRMQ